MSLKPIDLFCIILTHIVSALITFSLIQTLQLDAVLVVTAMGILGYGVSKGLDRQGVIHLAPNFYCGAFVGMVSSELLSIFGVFVAAFLSAFLFISLLNIGHGLGGRLGTIAFISCVVTVILIKLL